MSKSPSTNSVAGKLRKIAQQCERIEVGLPKNGYNGRGSIFTCNEVVTGCGMDIGHTYRETFCPDFMSERDLWNDSGCMGRRIIALCFMAAMVEAGDA